MSFTLRNIAFAVILFFAFPFSATLAQSGKMTITGDSLVGRIDNGERLREVIGNVVIRDSVTKITCDRSVQHLESGNIDLFGKVIFLQDTLRLFTERAHYLSSNKTGIIDTVLLLITPSDTIAANRGEYLTREKVARLYGNVILKSGGKKLSADSAIYFLSEDKIYAFGNASVSDSSSSLFADTLFYFRPQKITQAFGSVYLSDKKNNSEISSGALYDSANVKSVFTLNPVSVKIDTNANGADTLIVSAKSLMFVRDSLRKVFAVDSVKIIRGNFALVADSAFFNVDSNYFTAIRNNDEGEPVVLWFEQTQIYGDTVFVRLKNNLVEKVKITGDVLLIENIDSTRFRYNQMSGKKITLSFNNGSLKEMNVEGKALNIYYLVDDGKSQGLIKSSSGSAKIIFDSSGVAKVKLFENPNSEFHPEKLIKGKERDFLLPGFRVFGNKPKKKNIIDKLIINNAFNVRRDELLLESTK